ncbi:MAG: peptidoglycan-binding protein [Rhizobiaceae bacterium]|nr:peptidoglycan-binding protein [Rhizobiaceae bacterium]MCV0405850.1 peptidoglycan-binding protein [Rhizobiaceae bacterium]
MDNPRSPLDALNAGRRRRGSASLEELSRTLDSLESRFEQARRAAERHEPPAPSYQDSARPQRHEAPRHRHPTSQDDGITSEIKALRAELRHQMGTGLKHEFQSLRQEMGRTEAEQIRHISGELERINRAVSSLGSGGDPRMVEMLRAELNQIKAALGELAREDSVKAVDRRWDEFDRRWNAFEEKVSRAPASNFGAIADRIEQIAAAVDRLPQSLALPSLEERVRNLASVIERLARSQDDMTGAAFGALDARLDEISRAIAAAPVREAPSTDPDAIERIEARIALLGRQLEDAAMARDDGDVSERLALLQDRLDDVAQRAEGPERALESLNRQMQEIAARLDSVPATIDETRIAATIDDRLSLFSRTLGEQLSDLDAASQAENARKFDAIEDRITALAERIDAIKPGGMDETTLEVIENRFEDIARRIEQQGATAGLDPETIRTLETEIASLTAQIANARVEMPSEPSGDINARLVQVEKSVEGSRDVILEAARLAAENAVANFSGSDHDRDAITGLASDLKSLENLARRSDDRNARTFEAIHDTLLKIVDRLGTLEAPARKVTVADAPSIDASESIEDTETQPQPQAREMRAGRSPAEAAAAAAFAALNEDRSAEQPKPRAKRRTSLLGGIANVFSRSKKSDDDDAELKLAGDVAGEAAVNESGRQATDFDAPIEPRSENEPIEPGKGGPDLNAIMRRVRSERRDGNSEYQDKEASKSDFIAAARRAAQAAAAEAETLKKGSGAKPEKSARFSFGGAKRKPILMAVGALMIAIAGFQLGKAFLGGGEEIARVEPARIVAEAPDERPTGDGSTEAFGDLDATAEEPSEVTTPVRAASALPDRAAAEAVVRAAAPSGPSVDEAAETFDATENVASIDPASGPDASEEAATAEPETLSLDDVPEEAGPVTLRIAAANGDAKAMFEIGARYDEGRGVERNRETAATWYQRAAEAGFAPAQYRIGSFHEKGIGVDRDVDKAKTWYQLAAAQGNASAMHNLAVLFAMGPGGTPDNASAARWFLEAAELGVKDSQFNLGIMRAKGAGVEQDLEESYKWFALAAKQGDKDAADKRDEIANALRPDQLEKARATTELWKVREIKPEANVVDIPDEWKAGEEHTASVDMSKAVTNIQLILNKNGYDAGSADGVMGNRTRSAITAFQKDIGLEPTGEVDEKLVRELLARK